MASGSRKLPAQHITVRVPWHDSGWAGSVCKDPCGNTQCLTLTRVASSKNDTVEEGYAGKSFEDIPAKDLPPCVDEHSAFMSPFEIIRAKSHPYADSSPTTHGHLDQTLLRYLPYSAAAVPFRWMLKKEIEGSSKDKTVGKADELQLGYTREREPNLPFETSWVQERENQLVMLDTFFDALEPQTSLCFFYAKSTPLSEDGGRVIVGVGKIRGIGPSTEYKYKANPLPLRCMLWERCVVHSIRPGFDDGFLFPYSELLELGKSNTTLDLKNYIAAAPSEFREEFSYGSELLCHDGAIASLLSCASALHKIKEVLPGPWCEYLGWIDIELNRLWKARGAFPGLGSALCAFGLPQGNLIAYEINRMQESASAEWTKDPWANVNAVFENSSTLRIVSAGSIGATFQKKWKNLPEKRRSLLHLISRFAITISQATRFYQESERVKSGVSASDDEILKNPYILFELDRNQSDAITFGAIDRGLFPDEVVRTACPIPTPSGLVDAIDERRIRAILIDTLERAAASGDTLLPHDWVVQRVRDREISPSCPLDSDTLAVTETSFAPFISTTTMADGTRAFQLDRYVETKRIIAETIRQRTKSPRHVQSWDWRKLVDDGLGQLLPIDPQDSLVEQRARQEKAVALKEIYSSRFSVLIGSAGTGKTTLLKVLCAIDEVVAGGILLLAPTGKARVRLEEATQMRGDGFTIAQFLNDLQRYDGQTRRYYPNSRAPKSKKHKTVIIDECSMLTEEQLGALLDAFQGVERLLLVGDPRQLPPIGAGRPFVDIVSELAPEDVDTLFPKCAPGYAELTVTRRQQGKDRDDLLLAAHFSGSKLDPGADELWSRLDDASAKGIRLICWSNAQELQECIISEIVTALKLRNRDDETSFEVSLGGTIYEKTGDAFFWQGRGGEPGAAGKAENWQILAPVRGTLVGVDAINRLIQTRFRRRARALALTEDHRYRKIPRPMGSQGILWGDKVINIANSGRRGTWPKINNPYVANGDIGIVVGEYKSKFFTGTPKNIQVEFAGQPGVSFKYWSNEFSGDEANPALELAYALTVHKTQGSEFRTTFVIIPNPCRLLSRELLYTALTRHQDQIILLCQGTARNLLAFADDTSSEIARRVTNLFRDAAPREIQIGRERRFLEDRLIHRTERGEMVRSKSEVIIADKLHARKIDYAYEQPVILDGVERYPDFTIVDDNTGTTFYWEHLGMLDDPAYEARWGRKLDAYRKSGVLPSEEGVGSAGTLVISRDQPGGKINSQDLGELIEKVILGR